MSFIKSLESTFNIGQLIEELTAIAESGLGYAAKVVFTHSSIPEPIAISAVQTADAVLTSAASAAVEEVTPTGTATPLMATMVVHPADSADKPAE